MDSGTLGRMRKSHQALIHFATGRLAGWALLVIFEFFPVGRRAVRGARNEGHRPSKILYCRLGRHGGRELRCFRSRIIAPSDGFAAEKSLY